MGEERVIFPEQQCSIENITDDKLNFSVKYLENSRYYKGKYMVNIESTYVYDILDDNCTFVITGEKNKVRSDIYFDRLLVSADDQAVKSSEFFRIADEAEIKHLFNKKRIIYFLFIDLLACDPGMVIVYVILGVILFRIFGWKCAVLYFLIAYFVLLGVIWLCNYTVGLFAKKVLKMDDEKTEFYHFLSPDFINEFYSDFQRK